MSDAKRIKTTSRKKSRRDRSERDDDNDDDDELNLLHRLQEFQHKHHSLRISASSIAAMTGFHPFCSLPELMLKLVYQGSAGQALLRHDAKLLQLEMVDEETILLELARKASAETIKALQMALQVKMGTRKLDTVQTAHCIKQRVIEEAKKTNKLSAVELRLLQEGARSAIDTGYGTSHEDTALDLYEQSCGWPVRDRNAEILLWPFQRVPTNHNNNHTMISPAMMMDEVHAATVVPIRPPTSCWKRDNEANNNAASEQEKKKVKRSKEEGDNDLSDIMEIQCTKSIGQQNLNQPDAAGNGKDHADIDVVSISSHDNEETKDNIGSEHELSIANEAKTEAGQSSDPEIEHPESIKNQKSLTEPINNVVQTPASDPVLLLLSPPPFFVILGSVDGIREEMFPTPNVQQHSNPFSPESDDDDWQIRQVVVECKHRMKKIHPVPPLYEQIQTTAYCLMYDVTEADIIQVIRKERCPQHTSKATLSNSSNNHDNNNVNDHDGKKQASILNYVSSKQESSITSPETGQDDNLRDVAQVEIAVSRVSIDDPLFQHRYHWDKVVLPRLCSFVDAVYRIRASDEKRYRLLIAASSLSSSSSSQEAWRSLYEECPWLQSCDTACWQVL